MVPEDAGREYTLEQLETGSGIPERTIRSYIARGLLPPPEGRGRGASYAEEHLTRLRFIQAVRDATPYDLPLSLIERLLYTLPPEQIARVASGEEAVRAEVLGDVDPTLLRRRRSRDGLGTPQSPSADLFSTTSPRSEAPRMSDERSPREVRDEIWSSIDVTPDLRLSMRGPAGATRDDLQRLARRLRAWLNGASPD